MTSHQIDLHGYGISAALIEIDQELGQIFCQDDKERELRIFLGWGSRLRSEIRHFLMRHPLVEGIDLGGPAIVVEVKPSRKKLQPS